MSVREPTSEQRAAARPFASTWVTANAGSGKTRVLTDRVARLLLAGADPARILCLTYTKAAAAEMEKRLFEKLGGWSMLGDEELLKSLSAIEDEPVLPKRLPVARRLFARALETPGSLKIETIHAFCQRVLQRFPVEAGVAPDFSVLGDNESAALAAAAKRTLLRSVRAGANAAVEEALTRLLDARGEFVLKSILDDGLKKRSDIEAFLGHHDENGMPAVVRATFSLAPGETADAVRGQGHADPTRDDAGLRRAAAALGQGSKPEKERSLAITQYLAAEDKEPAAAAYRGVFLTKKGEALKNVMTAGARQRDPGSEDILRREQERIVRQLERERAAETADLSLAAFTLLREILARYCAEKEARRALDYDDLIAAMLRLLADASAAWVQFKLDGGIDHLLVDEAQDTSAQQWTIIRQLTEEFFAHEVASEGRLRTVFAVGDEKQSIYSFQGAEPRKFAEMRAHFEARARRAGREWITAALETSFRSTQEILDVVDRVCDPVDARRSLTGDIRAIRHSAMRATERGLVELWPALRRQSIDIAAHKDWMRPVDAPERSAEAKLGDKIARRIREWLDTRTPLREGGPAIACGDILILVRRRDALFYEAIRALNREQLPVAGADRMILSQEAAFLDLVALARFCLLPRDDLALAEVLKGPFVGLTDADLLRLAPGRSGSLWRALGAAPEHAAEHAFLEARIRDARALRPFEFFTRALDGPERKRPEFAARLGTIANDVIGEVLALALAHERKEAASLQGFVKFLAEHAKEIKRDMEEAKGRIRVMTVHGAKGLEAPIVFLIDTCRETRVPRDNWLLVHTQGGAVPIVRPPASERDGVVAGALARELQAENEEGLRELYVAMTRARDRLYVAGVAGPRDWGADAVKPDRWHARISTALAGLPGVEGMPGEDGEVLRYGREPRGRGAAAPAAAAPLSLPAWAAREAQLEAGPLRRTPSGLLPAEENALIADVPGTIFEAALRGRLIHRLLEELPKLARGERLAAARRLVQGERYRALASSTEEIVTEVLRVLDAPAFAEAFGDESRAEVKLAGTLLAPSGRRIFVSGQIDRLLVEKERVLVVDYKTNRQLPDPLPRAYRAQMAAYRELIRAVFPGRKVEAALLFTSLPRLVPLSEAELDVIMIAELAGGEERPATGSGGARLP